MSATPLFAGTAAAYGVVVPSAESNRITPTKYGTLVGVTSDNVNVPGINIKAQRSTIAGVAIFFLFDGSTNYVIHEEPITLTVPTQTSTSFEAQYVPDLPILVPAGWALRVAVSEDAPYAFTTINAGKF